MKYVVDTNLFGILQLTSELRSQILTNYWADRHQRLTVSHANALARDDNESESDIA